MDLFEQENLYKNLLPYDGTVLYLVNSYITASKYIFR
jgi:hypothetical protein